jgi:branched-chain amino acid aminotransferase
MQALVRVDRAWIPTSPGTSLYIRPTMIANEAALGVRAATQYLFYIIAGPVGAYYAGGFNPTRIYVSDEHVRAVRGGAGFAKTSCNYGPTLLVQQQALAKGYAQVLWLDAVAHRFVEEVGTSNIFFYIQEELITPPLEGTILAGVTRDSVLKLAQHWGIRTTQRPITIDEVIEACRSGALTETFATGTAAVVSPVGAIGFKGRDYQVADGRAGVLAQKLYDAITGIQYGRADDPFGWLVRVT